MITLLKFSNIRLLLSGVDGMYWSDEIKLLRTGTTKSIEIDISRITAKEWWGDEDKPREMVLFLDDSRIDIVIHCDFILIKNGEFDLPEIPTKYQAYIMRRNCYNRTTKRTEIDEHIVCLRSNFAVSPGI